jgi:DNA-binding transcriptional regulator YdaS (Cro superfamily)
MIAITVNGSIFIAADFVQAIALSEKQWTGKAYRVTADRYSAIISAPTGDAACAIMRRALAQEGKRTSAISFQSI